GHAGGEGGRVAAGEGRRGDAQGHVVAVAAVVAQHHRERADRDLAALRQRGAARARRHEGAGDRDRVGGAVVVDDREHLAGRRYGGATSDAEHGAVDGDGASDVGLVVVGAGGGVGVVRL